MLKTRKSSKRLHSNKSKSEVEKRMLSRDCDGCAQLKMCSRRFRAVSKGEKVYCQDGTAHLVDEDAVVQNTDLYFQNIEMFQ